MTFSLVSSNTRRVLSVLCHVGGQILNRWIPPPDFDEPTNQDGDDPCEDSALATLDHDSWLSLILDPALRNLLEWMQPVCEQKQGFAQRLAYYCHEQFAVCAAKGAHYILWSDRAYPENLRHIADPPIGLMVRGSLEVLKSKSEHVAVVGARKASAPAVRESFYVGRSLAEAGMVVVSGGAFGCDIAAHQGVLMARRQPCPAVVVFAGGLADFYPKANHRVFRELLGHGAAFVSERLWWAPARPFDFPVRNRIVSGLSSTTVMMEAGMKSGALSTARQALSQGREVLVLEPQCLDDVRSQGSWALVEEGARFFSGSKHLLDQVVKDAKRMYFDENHGFENLCARMGAQVTSTCCETRLGEQ